MNIDEIPTPESDAAYKQLLLESDKSHRIRMGQTMESLERRLTVAREALEKCLGWTHRALELEISSSMSAAQCVDIKSAREALDLTAPKQ